MVDALVSGTSDSNIMEVQVLSSAPKLQNMKSTDFAVKIYIDFEFMLSKIGYTMIFLVLGGH